MIKREAKFTVLFRHWLLSEKNDMLNSSVFELKQTPKNYLSYSAVKEHQLDALTAVVENDKGFAYKIPDDSRGIKPFDLLWLKYEWAFVVIKYPSCFVLIHVEKFIEEKNKNQSKSLDCDDARRIAYKVVNL